MLNFQEMIQVLSQFWAEQGCVIHQGYDLEVGAGTFNPATFLRCLGPEPYSAVYVEPSRRPKDGRYGDNPNRVQFYHQMQVILKPSPPIIQDLYIQSLERIGFDINKHDIRFVHDDWENPTIGAWGLGWEIWIDGMEVSQFTYFQSVGGLSVKPVSGEITYGLERLAMYLQGVDSMFDLKWNDKITYGDIFKRSEWEWTHYNFNHSNASMWLRHFEDFENEAVRLIQEHLPIPAYDFIMKCSHAFNMLDARGVISVTERTNYIARIRQLAKLLAEEYICTRSLQEFPLMRHETTEKKEKEIPLPPNGCDPNIHEDFLLEIGSEELPATFVPIGLVHLEKLFRNFLEANQLRFQKIEMYGTPRRLAILVRKLCAGTQSQIIEKKGPAISQAFDEKGMPTKAGEAFLKNCGHALISLQIIEKRQAAGVEIRSIKDTPYLFATHQIPQKSTKFLLAQHLKDLILNIDFPKKMRWGTSDIEYARPLRWIVALFGNEIIPFSLNHLASGNISYGHRQLAKEPFEIKSSSDYVDKLKSHFVMVNIEERKESILKQLSDIETELTAKIWGKEKVMPQVLHLVEWPFLTVGTFDKSFLQAPKEVLISEMIEHQKYFPIMTASEELLPRFAIVCNNRPTDLIRSGNQKALSPRLADGKFLYEEDLKTSLDIFNDKLKSVTYQKDLGSVYTKTQRIETIAALVHGYLPICSLEKLSRAAHLCKADLATELVGEFPELQGIIGKLYALHQGEDQEVALAIEEHWMPKGEKGALPKTKIGILLCLSEKIDNFLSCFTLDLKPTSSSDPYALRRQGIGVLKLLIEHQYHFPLRNCFESAFFLFLQNPEMEQKTIEKIEKNRLATLFEIEQFLLNRLRTIFVDLAFEKDEIEAVLAQGLLDPYDLYRKVQALHLFRSKKQKNYSSVHEVYTRARKILLSQKAENPTIIDPQLFKDASETTLHSYLLLIKNDFHTHLLNRREPRERKYDEALDRLASLQIPVNLFFEKVKVIESDPLVRQNRLALLREVWTLCDEVADFSKLQN